MHRGQKETQEIKFKCYFVVSHTKSRCRQFLLQNGAQKPPTTKESLKQIDVNANSEKQGLLSRLSEIINKAGESELFVGVEVSGNIL